MNQGFKRVLLALCMAALVLLVPSPALAYGFTPYGAFVAAAAAVSFLLLCVLRRKEAGTDAIGVMGRLDPVELALCVIPSALICARLSYCLVRFRFYFSEMGPLSVLRVWEGGFLLYGAMIGALAATALLARRRHVSIAASFDDLAAPGIAAIAISRLGEFTTGEGVGAWIENEALMRFPIAVLNEYEEWQLAVFLFEAATALVLLIPVLRVQAGRGRRMETALLLYAGCQIVLESLRMDSSLKIGFVRVSQVASAVVILIVTMMRAKRCGERRVMIRRLVALVLCVAVVGGIEWALEKTPLNNVFLYLLMIASCAAMMAGGMLFHREA